MRNSSQSLIPFYWDQLTTPEHILLVEPSCGEIAAFTELPCELSISASCPGNVDEELVCHLGHVDQTVSVHVTAVVKPCQLAFDEAELDFGMIRFGDTATRTLTVRNPGRSPVDWDIRLSPSVSGQDDADEFRFCPSAGTVRPLDVRVIEVIFHPKRCRALSTVFEVVCADGEKIVIGVAADVQHPQVCLLKSSVHTVAYLNVAAALTAVLFNQTALSTKFQWGEATCAGAADLGVSIEPRSGAIEARQTVSVSVSVTPHAVEPIRSLTIPCSIDGMDEPLNLSITADVYGLTTTATYSVSSDRESWLTGDGLFIDYGGNNLLHETPKRYLRIQNTSGISTSFRLEMEYFPSAVSSERSKNEVACETGPARLLKKTANVADPTAKTDAKALKQLRPKILSGGRGVAFHMNPSSGELAPFSEVIVEITAFADLWGFYSDLLQCHAGSLDLFTIPVMMSIVDSPILFQMVSHDRSLKPTVRFGCAVEGTKAVTRRTRILNESPLDIRIDWQMFNVSPDDEQLLDLVVVYGDPFPLKDENGKEIIVHSALSGHLTEDKYKRMPVDQVAVDTLAASRPQLISLNLREHNGTQATAPYSIEPSQLVRTSDFATTVISHCT